MEVATKHIQLEVFMANKQLSGLRQCVSGIEGSSVWIGVDVHAKKYHAAVISKTGACATWSCTANPIGFAKQIKALDLKIEQVAYEAGPTGFVLARSLKLAGLPVLVAAPSRIPRPVTAGAKTDRLDCLKLAEMAMRGSLRPIAIPSEIEEAKRSLSRRREQLTDQIRRVKQRIKSLLLEFGVQEPKGLRYWSRCSIIALAELQMPPGADKTLDSLLRELDYFENEKVNVKNDLDLLLNNEKSRVALDFLCTTPGVGPPTAQTFLLELFRPERFNNSAEVTSYLGLSPTTRHSGQGKARAYLKPTGKKRLRSLLIEAAWIWKRRDEYADQQYRRLLSRQGVAQKAITALARKLAVILWRICLEQRPYQPGPING